MIIKITARTTLAGLLKNPKSREILAKHNLPCLTCPLARSEIENLKLGQVCKMYNIDIEKLLKELNRVFKK